MVKQYDIIGDDWRPCQEPDGSYVTHDDYKALEAKYEVLKKQAADDAERLVHIANDPTGFSVAGILDEAKNWTRRETGKEMLLNYAAALDIARQSQEKKT